MVGYLTADKGGGEGRDAKHSRGRTDKLWVLLCHVGKYIIPLSLFSYLIMLGRWINPKIPLTFEILCSVILIFLKKYTLA